MAADPDDGALARRVHELEVLYESLRALSSTLDLAQLVRTVLNRIKSVTSAEGLSLLLYDAARAELVFVASETLCEETLTGGRPASMREVGSDARRLVVALQHGDRRVGLLDLRDRYDGGAFDAADRARVEAIAAELAPALDPATIAHDAEALELVFARVASAVPSRTTVLLLHDPGGRQLVFTSSRVLRAGVVDGVRLRLDQGIAGWVARHRETVCLDDAAADARHDPTLANRTGLVPRSMICVPLLHRDELLGVLQVINNLDGPRFTPEQLRLVEALAGQAAIAIANAQLYHRVEVASITDDLTGLGNTRHFGAVLPAALAHGGPVSLLVLDLDGLKGVVDRDGHLVGSRAIATVGRLISERIRPGDMAARFGGDEFVVVMPATTTEVARTVAEQIRAAVAACAKPDGMENDITTLTASVGVATFPTHGSDAERLFRAADRAMYRAKFGGKNGVAVADGRDAPANTR